MLYKNDKNNIISNEKTKYNCRVLLQIQSVYYSIKDKDIRYYSQVLLEQCGHTFFSNNTIIHPDLVFSDNKPDDNDESDESEEDFNENTV